MKYLVFSDSHGHSSLMEEVIESHLRAGGLECVFYLGDGLHDLLSVREKWPYLTIYSVAGNCDSSSLFTSNFDEPYERCVHSGCHRFLLMHGHKYNVKSTLQLAADRGIESGADVVLFGHTHEKFDETIDGTNGSSSIRLINPGSVGTWYHASFALLESVGDELLCSFGGRSE